MATTAGTAALHAVPDTPFDRERAISAVAELLTALGHDIDDEDDLADTPRRVADGLLELRVRRDANGNLTLVRP